MFERRGRCLAGWKTDGTACRHDQDRLVTIRYAIILKTYVWDDFVARQVERLRLVAGSGDLFVSVDETNGTAGPIPHDKIVRTCNADMVALGLADRFEKGSLLWWNADYPHYQFFDLHRTYDYYLFIEYDACVTGGIETLVARAAEQSADFVALPNRFPHDRWRWAKPHAGTYSLESMRGSLNCITLFSARAMRLLMRRRLEMSRQPDIPFWPISEVFLATEIAAAGYVFLPLQQFGDVSRYDWFPPFLEDDLPAPPADSFIHPLLDRHRYIQSLLRQKCRLRDILPHSALRRELDRLSERASALQIARQASRQLLRRLVLSG